MLYSGTYERSLDAKKRVAVPSDWVSGEGEVFFVIPHPREGYLMVMPHREFDRWEQKIQESGATPGEKRQAIRDFYGTARTVTADKQGRILLPDAHCTAAALKSEVVFVGSKSRFEIWAKDRFESALPANTEVFKRVADMIGL